MNRRSRLVSVVLVGVFVALVLRFMFPHPDDSKFPHVITTSDLPELRYDWAAQITVHRVNIFQSGYRSDIYLDSTPNGTTALSNPGMSEVSRVSLQSAAGQYVDMCITILGRDTDNKTYVQVISHHVCEQDLPSLRIKELPTTSLNWDSLNKSYVTIYDMKELTSTSFVFSTYPPGATVSYPNLHMFVEYRDDIRRAALMGVPTCLSTVSASQSSMAVGIDLYIGVCEQQHLP